MFFYYLVQSSLIPISRRFTHWNTTSSPLAITVQPLPKWPVNQESDCCPHSFANALMYWWSRVLFMHLCFVVGFFQLTVFFFKAQTPPLRNSLFAVNYVTHTKRCGCTTRQRAWPWPKRMRAVLQVWGYGTWRLALSSQQQKACLWRFEPQEWINPVVSWSCLLACSTPQLWGKET